MLKNFYYSPHSCGKDDKSVPMVLASFSGWDLDAQQGLFKLTTKLNVVQTMVEVVVLTFDKVNRTNINPLTRM
jgi:hypothetical protein